jgi:uncharacterized membrane protein YgdD (TMEM256/DUF423 family)
MIRRWLAIAGLGGLSSVAMGALATHLVDDAQATDLLRTGALYGMVHATVLIALIGVAQGREPRRGAAVVAGWSFGVGIMLFSGSLFVRALTGMTQISWATPIGGAALMLGWTALGFPAFRRRRFRHRSGSRARHYCPGRSASRSAAAP